MKRLTSIVAVSRNGAIGCQNKLPWRLKSDLQFFKKTTRDNVVIMGRRTFDSIGGCLPQRTNIVLSHNGLLFQSTPTCILRLSISETLFEASRQGRKKEIFIVGGASTYEQFAPFVDRYLVTIVDKVVDDADAFLPEDIFGNPEEWNIDTLGEYPAVDGVDEVGFTIFEWTAKDQVARRALRDEAIAAYASRNHLLKGNRRKSSTAKSDTADSPFELHL